MHARLLPHTQTHTHTQHKVWPSHKTNGLLIYEGMQGKNVVRIKLQEQYLEDSIIIIIRS
jgi:hypothetical protein